MKAVVHDRYGPPEVLRIEEVPRPVPAADEVLVRVHATSVSVTDCGLRSAEFVISRFVTGLRRPKHRTLGMDFAGVVEGVGDDVTELQVGDEVFGGKGHGGHAEYLTIQESSPITRKPAGMTFDEAAAVYDGVTLALACLSTAGLSDGQSVLVYGASGSVGTAGVQLAKYLGATVTAVCNTKNVDLVRSLGADAVIDYEQEDFTTAAEGRFDVVFDAVGKTSFRRCRRLLKRGGTYVDTDLGYAGHVPFLVLLTRWVGHRRVKLGIARFAKEDLVFLRDAIEAGRYRAVIDRRYPLEDVVEATRYVETRQKTGNVVLTVGPHP